jgi:hypothetical protein
MMLIIILLFITTTHCYCNRGAKIFSDSVIPEQWRINQMYSQISSASKKLQKDSVGVDKSITRPALVEDFRRFCEIATWPDGRRLFAQDTCAQLAETIVLAIEGSSDPKHKTHMTVIQQTLKDGGLKHLDRWQLNRIVDISLTKVARSIVQVVDGGEGDGDGEEEEMDMGDPEYVHILDNDIDGDSDDEIDPTNDDADVDDDDDVVVDDDDDDDDDDGDEDDSDDDNEM